MLHPAEGSELALEGIVLGPLDVPAACCSPVQGRAESRGVFLEATTEVVHGNGLHLDNVESPAPVCTSPGPTTRNTGPPRHDHA